MIAQAKKRQAYSQVLADLLRSDMVCESFVPDKQYRELRNMVRTRLGLIRTRTTYKNKIHSILAKYEYLSPYKTFSKGIKWLKEIELTDTDRMAMDAYLDEIQTTQKQIDIFESHMASISKEDQRTRLLMTIPANYITALTVIS